MVLVVQSTWCMQSGERISCAITRSWLAASVLDRRIVSTLSPWTAYRAAVSACSLPVIPQSLGSHWNVTWCPFWNEVWRRCLISKTNCSYDPCCRDDNNDCRAAIESPMTDHRWGCSPNYPKGSAKSGKFLMLANRATTSYCQLTLTILGYYSNNCLQLVSVWWFSCQPLFVLVCVCARAITSKKCSTHLPTLFPSNKENKFGECLALSKNVKARAFTCTYCWCASELSADVLDFYAWRLWFAL